MTNKNTVGLLPKLRRILFVEFLLNYNKAQNSFFVTFRSRKLRKKINNEIC